MKKMHTSENTLKIKILKLLDENPDQSVKEFAK